MRSDGLARLTRRDAIVGAAAAALATSAIPAQGAQRSRPLPTLDGELRFDEATRRAAADDFGHLVHRAPEAVLFAASRDDVAKTILWAGRRGLKFAARGNGHSTFGRSQVEHGIVADMSRLRTIGAVEGDRIVVEAGAKWSEVLDVTLARGMTPPVLTDYLELSVGGTLVVGGVGGTTSAFGVQADNVIEIEVVTGAGETIVCSAEHHPHLFDAVRAGLGQVGVVTQATLELVQAPQSVRRFLLAYPDLGTMLAEARALASDDRFDAVQGAIRAAPGDGFDFRLDVANFDAEPPDDSKLLAGLSDDAARREAMTTPYRGYLERLAPLEAALRANGQWHFPHPWLTTFIGDRQVESVVTAELAALKPPADLGPLGQIVLSPLRTSAISSPLLRMPSDELSYAFNLVRLPATDDRRAAGRLVEANKATYRRIKAAGGTLYPVSALALSRRQWRDHFGPAFVQLEAAKRRFDPNDTLTPGYEVF